MGSEDAVKNDKQKPFLGKALSFSRELFNSQFKFFPDMLSFFDVN